jgi:hypothetical protein
MNKIALISCCSKKNNIPCTAEQMYISPVFQKSLAYARMRNADQIFVLSALHGLLRLDDIIAPYDLTLKSMTVNQRQLWAGQVINELLVECDLNNDLFMVLAGLSYREFLVPNFNLVEVPLAGMRIGEQLQFLKNFIDGQV